MKTILNILVLAFLSFSCNQNKVIEKPGFEFGTVIINSMDNHENGFNCDSIFAIIDSTKNAYDINITFEKIALDSFISLYKNTLDTLDKTYNIESSENKFLRSIHSYKYGAYILKEFIIEFKDDVFTIYEIENYGPVICFSSGLFCVEPPYRDVFINRSKDPKIREMICDILNKKSFFYIHKELRDISKFLFEPWKF